VSEQVLIATSGSVDYPTFRAGDVQLEGRCRRRLPSGSDGDEAELQPDAR
jgi:hypothetical protein